MLRGERAMKHTDTLYYFVPVLIGAAGLVASIAFGSVDTSSSASQNPVTEPSVQIAVYFPAQYKLNAPAQVEEHIQAF
jgi:hypothetical protein